MRSYLKPNTSASCLAAALLLAQAGTVGSSVAGQQPQAAAAAQPASTRYLLKSNDVLTLAFRFTPELDQEVAVQPDGFVQLKELPDAIHVQDLSVPEATEAIRKAYSTKLHDPIIIVVLKEFDKPFFIVSGAVNTPGKFELRGRPTVMEAVAMAGGFDHTARHSQIVLMRRYSKDLVQATMVDLRQVTKGNELKKDLVVQPGDTIFVPKSAFSKFDRFLPSSSVSAYQRY